MQQDTDVQEVEQTDAERTATILQWAQRLMILKGYGWSKAVDAARDLYGESANEES